MYNNGTNGQRRNNNQRRNNSRGGAGKSNGRSNRPPRNFDDENISPQQKRHFINKRDTHLSRGKELRAAGDRVEAENEFQHAEHYTRMIKIADDQQQKYNERKAAENPQQNVNNGAEHNAENGGEKFAETRADIVSEKEMISEGAPVEAGEGKAQNEPRNRNNQRRPKRAVEERSTQEPQADIAELSFMQPIPLADSGK
jgi:hypothetical protein